MKTPTTLIVTFVATLAGGMLQANAALTMFLNTNTKEYYFTGTTSGTAVNDGSHTRASWTGGADNTGETSIGDLGQTLVTDWGGGGSDGLFAAADGTPDPLVRLDFVFDTASTGQAITFTGTGAANATSYANDYFQHGAQSLESFIGKSIALGTGNGFEAISVVEVPEPSSTALLGLGGLALILRRRK